MLAGVLSACARAPKREPHHPAPQRPVFDSTHGAITGTRSALSISFKQLQLVSILGVPAALPDASAPALSLADFLLLSSSKTGVPSTARPALKILAPRPALEMLSKAGFSNIREAVPDAKTLVKKEEAYAFIAPVDTGVDGALGYFLEFDNGRNILVLPAVPPADALREFVYGVRDDGKEIHMVTLPLFDHQETGRLAEVIALLQPRHALLFTGEQPHAMRRELDAALRENLFFGNVYQPASGETIPF